MKIKTKLIAVQFGDVAHLSEKNVPYCKARLALEGFSEAVWLNYVEQPVAKLLVPGTDVTVEPEVNEYKGITSVQFRLVDDTVRESNTPPDFSKATRKPAKQPDQNQTQIPVEDDDPPKK